jgi:hypothetical protein
MHPTLILGLSTPAVLALLALVLILLVAAHAVHTMLRLRKLIPAPAPARKRGRHGEAPYKIETPIHPHGGRLDVVRHAGRDPANR